MMKILLDASKKVEQFDKKHHGLDNAFYRLVINP